MKRKLPARPLVVVADHLIDRVRGTRVLECLATLGFSGFLEEVRAHVRVAEGALVQQARILPARTKRAAAFGLRVLARLESLVAGAGMWLAMREAGSERAAAFGEAQLRGVQALMDLVHEADSAFDRDARISVAGLGGGGAWWSNHAWVASGFEEAVGLANDVRLVVLGVVENPFARFLVHQAGASGAWSSKGGERKRTGLGSGAAVLSARRPDGSTWTSVVSAAEATRPPRKQVGREKPARPDLTAPDDVAILRAMRSGLSGKQVAPATGGFGMPLRQDHVNHRRRDLVRWGWVSRGRNSKLTPEGERWLSEVPLQGAGVPGAAPAP
jgi:hypothetical protein